MQTDEVVIGQKYLFVNNGNIDHKKEFHNQIGTVLKRIKGKSNTSAFHRNKRGKKPDKFWLDIGVYANPANLKNINI